MSVAEILQPEADKPIGTDWFVRVVRVDKIVKHPNADTLGIVNVLGGYPVLVKLGDFKEGDLGVYCTVDTLVPISRPEYKFLDTGRGRTHERVKAKKLRGVFSMGLLVPLTFGAVEGEDVAGTIGALKYVPPSEKEHHVAVNALKKSRISETAQFDRRTMVISALASLGSAAILPHGPLALLGVLPLVAGYAVVKWNRWRCRRPSYPMYDVTSYRAYKSLIADGEDVIVTEKCHGSNSSWCHTGRKFHMKSRTVFRDKVIKDNKSDFGFNFTDTWSMIAEKYDLERKLKTKPGMVLFGEIVGSKIQKGYSYGCKPGDVAFYAFDVMRLNDRKFLDHDDMVKFCEDLEIPMVPILYRGAWSEALANLAEGKSVIDGVTQREGIVFKPLKERYDNHAGRVQLKLVGEGYLLSKSKEDE